MTDKEKLEKLKKLADAMYYAAQYLTTDASKLHKAMDEYHQFLIYEYYKEEPTIPDIVDEHWWEILGEKPVSEDLEEAAHRCYKANDTFMDGFKKGANWQREQIMKDAVEGEITKISPNDYLRAMSDVLPLKDESKWGTRVKLIIIKED